MNKFTLIGLMAFGTLVITACSNPDVEAAYATLEDDRTFIEDIASTEDVTEYCGHAGEAISNRLDDIEGGWKRGAALTKSQMMALVKEGKKDDIEDKARDVSDKADNALDEFRKKLKEQC